LGIVCHNIIIYIYTCVYIDNNNNSNRNV